MLAISSAAIGALLVASAAHSRGRPVSCCAAEAAPVDPAVLLFDSILKGEKINHALALQNTPAGRSLVASRDIEAGGALLTVPKRLLITAHRSGVVDGLAGQTDLTWDAAGDLREEVGQENFSRGARWDARLALGVFEACAGAGGEFWDTYRRLLPPPPRIAHPLTLPEPLLAELQDDAVVTRTRELRNRLVSLYPELDTHGCLQATAAYESMGAPMEQIPMPLQYTYALVVSRCFTMADGDTFAFVPILDMADHEARPAANFTSDARGFVLRALRPIKQGDSVTICYGEDYTTERMFEQYGFSPAQGTAQDAKWLRAVVAEAIAADAPEVATAVADAPAMPLGDSLAAMQALGTALEAREDSPVSTSERRAALFDCLVPPDPTPGADELPPVAPGVVHAAVRWKLGAFPTSLEEDEGEMAAISSAEGPTDPRALAVIEYRIARKRLLSFCDQVLGLFLGQ